MSLVDSDKEIIHKYWKTLIRKNISNISLNNFIKKPYIEDYIIELSIIIDDNVLNTNIIYLIENNIVNNEELLFFLNNYIELSNDSKKNIEQYIFKNDIDNTIKNIAIKIILYVVKYFRFYQTVSELLFDDVLEDNELYNYILIYIKNRSNEIKLYLKNNFKFIVFHYYISDLYNNYNEIYRTLLKLKFINEDNKDNEDNENNQNNQNNHIYQTFLKKLFIPWYNIYKNDIINDNLKNKVKVYYSKKSILSRILCMNNT
jgi:hypothetical protein